jgi:hypothetical protein
VLLKRYSVSMVNNLKQFWIKCYFVILCVYVKNLAVRETPMNNMQRQMLAIMGTATLSSMNYQYFKKDQKQKLDSKDMQFWDGIKEELIYRGALRLIKEDL